MTPRVSAVCVSRNCADLLRVTLASLALQEVTGGCEVIVVDNASDDGTAAVPADFPGVAAVALERNVGFAAANNLGAARARGELLLFVNPDVDVPAGVVEALSRFLGEREAAAAAGPTLAGRDGALQKYAARREPTLANLLAQVSGIGESWPLGAGLAHRFYPTRYYRAGPARAEVLGGAFMMVRAAAFREVGGFDEGYFLYAEDMDLSRRLAAVGELWYVPTAPVRHYTGGSRRTPSPLVAVASHASAERYARIWMGPAAAALVRACSRASWGARRLAWGALGAFSPAAKKRAAFYAEVARAARR